MKYFKWKIHEKLQSNEDNLFEKAERDWEKANLEYDIHLNKNHILNTYKSINFHDYELNKIKYSDQKLYLMLKNRNNKFVFEYDLLSFNIFKNEISKDYPKTQSNNLGTILISEFLYENHLHNNILFDNGLELNVGFKELKILHL
ncbi:hypothetical protein GCM10022393_20790 [Aquimarina addita]|uniref:Histidine kinase n=1 Tax=Aquimarina addita TaxID=870485 RepID=A0ABP6UJ12_9FLAO